jgi:hypothetical protein
MRPSLLAVGACRRGKGAVSCDERLRSRAWEMVVGGRATGSRTLIVTQVQSAAL